MTKNQKKVFLSFYKDIIDNSKAKHIEYFYNSELDYFKDFINNDEDYISFFGKELLITNPNEFSNALKSKLGAKYVDLAYDLYGSTEYYYMILFINSMTNIKEFNRRRINLMRAKDMSSVLSAIYSSESEYIERTQQLISEIENENEG